jgi:hypothetical protein
MLFCAAKLSSALLLGFTCWWITPMASQMYFSSYGPALNSTAALACWYCWTLPLLLGLGLLLDDPDGIMDVFLIALRAHQAIHSEGTHQ